MRGSDGESPLAAYTGASPRGRRPHAAVIAVVALLGGIGVAGCQGQASSAAPSSAATSPSASGAAHSSSVPAAPLRWSAARAPLPADTNGVSGQYATLDAVSCPEAGSCVAVGGDKVGGNVYQGLAETLSHGTWTPAAVPDVSSTKGVAFLTSVSCPAPGTCVAVGFVTSAAGALTPVIETLSGGRWAAVKPPLPDDAITSASATLNDVSCLAAYYCFATGWYGNNGGARDGYVDMLANGTWTAVSLPLPADAAPEQTSAAPSTYATGVACTGADACVAPGQYRAASGQTKAFIDTLSGGSWTATAVPLPGDAAATGQIAGLWAIACPAPGTCVAAGHYIKSGGQPRYLTDTLSGGAWTTSALSLPADAAADQKWSQDESTSIGGLTCPSVGYCVATAGYVTKANAIVPLIETLSGRTWTAAEVPLPADAAPGSGQGNATYLQLVTCTAADNCVTVGSYPSTDGTTQGLIETGVPRHA